MTKICSACNVEKPQTEFHKDKTKDGKMSRCKACYNQRHLEKSARGLADGSCGDTIEELTRHENALIREFLEKREREQNECK